MSNVPPPPPPPPPPGPPPGYSPYGGFGSPTPSKKAMWALVCGIVGFLINPVSIVAIVLGKQAQAEIDASNGALSGRGQATAGFTLGIVGLGLWVVSLMFLFG